MTDVNEATGPNSINKMIKAKIIKKLDSGLWIQLKNVHDKKRDDGSCWNRRDMNAPGTLEHIQGIAAHLMRDGIVPAIEVQAHPESGVVKIDGYCRTEAYRLADASGEGDVWIPIVQFKGDELDCLARIESSNRDRKLTPLEQLDLYQSTRDELKASGLKGTLAEIAHVMNVSRQYVDQILKLGSLDDAGKALVADGKVTVAQAVKAVREGAEAATENLKTKAVENKEKAGPKAPQVAPSLLADLFTMTANIRRSLSVEVHAAATEFLQGARPATDMVSIEVGHLARLMALQDEGERQLEVKASKAKSKAEAANQEPIPADDLAPVDSIPADVQAKLDDELAHVDSVDQALADIMDDAPNLGDDEPLTDAGLDLKDAQDLHEQEENNQFAFLG
jgi:hypothetical protein